MFVLCALAVAALLAATPATRHAARRNRDIDAPAVDWGHQSIGSQRRRLEVLALEVLAHPAKDRGRCSRTSTSPRIYVNAGERAGCRRRSLAHRCDLHPTEISRLERAVREPRLSTIVRLACALDIEPKVLLDGVECN